MEKLQFDSGIKEYKINGAGVLRFNPGDPNLYARFLEAGDKLLQRDAAAHGRGGQADEAGAGLGVRPGQRF